MFRRALVLTLALSMLAVPAGADDRTSVPIAQGGYRLEVADGGTLTVAGLGRYADTIEILPAPDGSLQIVNELGLDTYVEGLGEMPASWPMESLKAQAVAARTYAWYVERRDYYRRELGLDFDICATTACQVFHGRAIVETPDVGPRWAEAVAATAGEVLHTDDRPILARFFSSSGGASRANEDVFPSSGARPYLVDVDDPHDAATSPLARWRVQFSRRAMDAILAEGDTLQHAVPMRAMEFVPSDGTRTDLVRITRQDGHVVDIAAPTFRRWVSTVAPQLFPGSFPQRREDGGRMPATLPSSRLAFSVTDQHVIVDGRGWGHGVGMSQYGAKGKAADGWSYDRILETYYPTTTPATHDRAPERVRVGLSWSAEATTVTADRDVRVVRWDGSEARLPAGAPWSFGAASSERVASDEPSGIVWRSGDGLTRRLPRLVDPAPRTAVAERPDAGTDAPAPHLGDGELRDTPGAAPLETPVTAPSWRRALRSAVRVAVPGVTGVLGVVRRLRG